MIYINLVPENLRKRKSAQNLMAKATTSLPKETVQAVIIGFLFLLGFCNLILQITISIKCIQLRAYENQLKHIAIEKGNAERVLTELRSLQSKVKSIENITGNNRILWTYRLNAISDSITRGVWLSRISFDENVLRLQGSAVSKDLKEEMINIHSFTNELQKQQQFMQDIQSIELGLIKTRKLNNTQVNDFTITASFKAAK